MQQLYRKTNGDVTAYILAIKASEIHNPPSGELQELLQEFEEVFHEPNQLPLSRKHDHTIPLQEGTQASLFFFLYNSSGLLVIDLLIYA
jgi:hypothetical protein